MLFPCRSPARTQSFLPSGKKAFTEKQILDFLKQAEAGVPVKELCRRHGVAVERERLSLPSAPNQVKLIQPGKPTQTAFIESFTGKFREECLNEHWFCSLVEARIRIAAWRRDYNGHRPHSAIGNLTSAEFAASWRTRQQQLKQEKLISTY
ncbi:integrase core domain-containing protein [Pseudomonas paraeruginosa]|uniref:integrase core domain-containing protein n=1 Tax=Pseudomonas paraeruginosa TaxID=2994495 RepID=UPI0039FD2514